MNSNPVKGILDYVFIAAYKLRNRKNPPNVLTLLWLTFLPAYSVRATEEIHKVQETGDCQFLTLVTNVMFGKMNFRKVRAHVSEFQH
jgi:hypothetical protein